MNRHDRDLINMPDVTVKVADLFGFASNMVVPAYSERDSHVPELDPDYLFDPAT
ncbi:MAG: cobaltochelatase subunit CobS, partial [Rhodobacteraceae bacterium]|nr:cobaltochelatase subunit CobS [Paracoccaceae bacterium]